MLVGLNNDSAENHTANKITERTFCNSQKMALPKTKHWYETAQ